jgi:predicted NodU family carbamoyl transferase
MSSSFFAISSNLHLLLLFFLTVISNIFIRCSSYSASSFPKGLILGLNKYSHDASCCLIDASNGEIIFSQAKERVSRKKHDGGGIGRLLRYALHSVDATTDDITCVVSNNHHHRVLPFEKRFPFYSTLNYIPAEYSDVDNLLPGKKHLELSHHLAHAWSALGTAPFKEGLVVVMDGMGETFRAMSEDMGGLEKDSGDYMHDLKVL